MRTSTLVRSGAALTASMLALSLGTVAASADDSSTVKVKADSTTAGAHAAPAATGFSQSGPVRQDAPGGAQAAALPKAGDVTLKTFRLNDGVLVRKALNGVNGTVSFTFKSGVSLDTTQGWPAVADVYVNGKKYLNQNLYYTGDASSTPGGIDLRGNWGPGRVTLSGVKVLAKTSDGTAVVQVPGTEVFYARRLVSSNQTYPLTIDRVNSRIKFTAHGVKILNPYKGSMISAGTVKLQYATSSGWKLKKTIKLSSSGSGSYTTYTNTKRHYRLYYPETNTATEFRTKQSGNI